MGIVALSVSELPEKIRAFIAIRTDPAVERVIGDLIDELRAPGDGIRWVSRSHLHLTLKFLGPAVPLDKIDQLKTALEEISAKTAPIELEVAGVGAFPNLHTPRVLWVGLGGAAIGELAKRIDDGAAQCGFAREKRAFSPHLTIARINSLHRWGITRRALEPVLGREFGASAIRTMTLYRSTLTSKGSIYDALAQFRFGR